MCAAEAAGVGRSRRLDGTMRRREFTLGGAEAGWLLTVRPLKPLHPGGKLFRRASHVVEPAQAALTAGLI